MPRINGISDQYQFYFFSNELSGGKQEPVHVHVRKDHSTAKIWLDGNVYYNKGFSPIELQHIQKLVSTNKSRIEEVWNEHFGDN